MDYIEEYKKTPSPKINIEFNWLFYNTAIYKMIMRIIMFLKEADSKVNIIWYYNQDFEMIKEKGEEIKEVLEIPIEITQK